MNLDGPREEFAYLTECFMYFFNFTFPSVFQKLVNELDRFWYIHSPLNRYRQYFECSFMIQIIYFPWFHLSVFYSI